MVPAPRVRDQLLRRAPIGHEDRRAPEPGLAAEKAELRMRLELAQHPRHGPRRPQPLPHLPPAIDPHADEEDHEISLHPPRHPLLNRRAHDLLLALTLLTRVNSVNIPGKKIQGTKPMNRCAV